MPLGVKKVRKANNKKNEKMNPKKAALRLLKFERKLFSDKLSKKQKKDRKHGLIDPDISLDNSKSKDASNLDVNHSNSEDASDLDMDIDHSQNKDASNLNTDMDATNLENDSIEMAASTKTHTQNLHANVPSKKQKKKISIQDKAVSKRKFVEDKEEKPEIKNISTQDKAVSKRKFVENKEKKSEIKNISTHNKSVSKRKFVEDKEEKPEIKTKKKNKMKKIKLERESDTPIANERAKHKIKTALHKQASDSKDQCAFAVPAFFQNQVKKLQKTNNKTKINKPVPKSHQISASRNNQKIPLKTV